MLVGWGPSSVLGGEMWRWEALERDARSGLREEGVSRGGGALTKEDDAYVDGVLVSGVGDERGASGTGGAGSIGGKEVGQSQG